MAADIEEIVKSLDNCPFGKIVKHKSFNSDNNSGNLVVFIGDEHGSQKVQHDIASTVIMLYQTHGIKLYGIEGGNVNIINSLSDNFYAYPEDLRKNLLKKLEKDVQDGKKKSDTNYNVLNYSIIASYLQQNLDFHGVDDTALIYLQLPIVNEIKQLNHKFAPIFAKAEQAQKIIEEKGIEAVDNSIFFSLTANYENLENLKTLIQKNKLLCELRSHAMIDNLSKLMKVKNQNLAGLIAGIAHSDSVEEELISKQTSYILYDVTGYFP